MAKIEFHKLSCSHQKGKEIKSIANSSEEDLKERRQMQSELMRKQGETRLGAQKIVLWGNLDKLNKESPKDSFCEVAHYLILLQEKKFSYAQLYRKYLGYCDETVEQKYAHSVLIETLTDCLNDGLVRFNKDETYQSIFVDEKETSVKQGKERVL